MSVVKYPRKSIHRGGGLLITRINKLPVELHIPGYNFCGPGTRVEKRLRRGDRGINKLDAACRNHDIAYSQTKNLQERHSHDRILAEAAAKLLKSSDASVGEKLAALGITSAKRAKVKMGLGAKKGGKMLSFQDVVTQVRLGIKKNKPTDLNTASKIAFNAVKRIKRKNRSPRVIPVPKTGGFLPLIPLFAGLSALGALSGGAAGIAKAVNDTKSSAQELKESQRIR